MDDLRLVQPNDQPPQADANPPPWAGGIMLFLWLVFLTPPGWVFGSWLMFMLTRLAGFET